MTGNSPRRHRGAAPCQHYVVERVPWVYMIVFRVTGSAVASYIASRLPMEWHSPIVLRQRAGSHCDQRLTTRDSDCTVLWGKLIVASATVHIIKKEFMVEAWT